MRQIHAAAVDDRLRAGQRLLLQVGQRRQQVPCGLSLAMTMTASARSGAASANAAFAVLQKILGMRDPGAQRFAVGDPAPGRPAPATR